MATTQQNLAGILAEFVRQLGHNLEPHGRMIYSDGLVSRGGGRVGDTVMVRSPIQLVLNEETMRNMSAADFRRARDRCDMVTMTHRLDVRLPLYFSSGGRTTLPGDIHCAVREMEEQIRNLWPPGATLVVADSIELPAPSVDATERRVDLANGISAIAFVAYDPLSDTVMCFISVLFGFLGGVIAVSPLMREEIHALRQAIAQWEAQLAKIAARAPELVL